MTAVQDIDLLNELENYLDVVDSMLFALTDESVLDSAIAAAHNIVAELKRRALCNTTLH